MFKYKTMLDRLFRKLQMVSLIQSNPYAGWKLISFKLDFMYKYKTLEEARKWGNIQ